METEVKFVNNAAISAKHANYRATFVLLVLLFQTSIEYYQTMPAFAIRDSMIMEVYNVSHAVIVVKNAPMLFIAQHAIPKIHFGLINLNLAPALAWMYFLIKGN